MRKTIALLTGFALLLGLFAACGSAEGVVSTVDFPAVSASEPAEAPEAAPVPLPDADSVSVLEDSVVDQPEDPGQILQDQAAIEEVLNLKNNPDQAWTYSSSYDAWTLSVVSAVAFPEIPEKEGVSVNVPGAYVIGIDTVGDGQADITAADTDETEVYGALVIDYDAEVTSPNGQTYTAATAPVILNTGAAGYGSATNTLASGIYAADGYINVSCGNRGKQDAVYDEDGNISYYTGDAPSCLCDQKAATRFVKYNMLLGNLPGSVDYFVSTGGSGGAAHASMFAATSNNPDFYDYEIEVGAVGVYQYENGSYSTTVTIDGTEYDISDGAWGCVAYSAITSLSEGDITMAFEYYLDTEYAFGSPFQKQLAAHLSETYMNYINDQNLSVAESAVGFDLTGDGDQDDTVPLTIEYDPNQHPETNGYFGTYLDLYLAEFQQNLQWYLDNLSYAEGWTWFHADGAPMTDDEVAAMTDEDRTEAFLSGNYTAASMGFGPPVGMMGPPPDMMGGPMGAPGGPMGTEGSGDDMVVGTPEAGTTQSASSGIDSKNYDTYDELLAAYESDIAEVNAGDRFGKNIVDLYNPLNYIGAAGTENPTWLRIMMGASEGDMSMLSSLNMQIAALNAGTDADIQWQWNGGHVPSEIFGESLALYVDQMYGKHVAGAATGIQKAPAAPMTENGDSESPTGKDISDWVTCKDGVVSFTLPAAAAYRTSGAMKAIPGFDVIDYGQEDYVFGSPEKDARHWDSFVLDALQAHRDTLEPLYNK